MKQILQYEWDALVGFVRSITQLEPECADEEGKEEWCFFVDEIISDFVLGI